MSDIQSLTLRIQELNRSVDWWNTAMIVALVFAALAAIAVVVTTRIALTRAKSLADTQGEFIQAKDNQLALDLGDKDVRIAEALGRAGEANERASANEREAARLTKLSEDERLARVKIEKQLAPRTITDSDRKMISEQLRQFAPGFSGRKVKISSYTADAEGIVFSLEVMDILTRAGINVEPIIGRTIPVGMVNLGVKVTGPIADEMFIRSLLTGIRAHLETDLHGEWGPTYAEVAIEVGVKPVAGLPAIVPIPE